MPVITHQAVAVHHAVFAFRSTFLGSRAVAGTLIKHNQLSARGPDGRTLEEVLKTSGGVTGAAGGDTSGLAGRN
jgi:hypothetical protein